MINFKEMLRPHYFVMKSLHKCACSEMGSVDVGWKGSLSPTSAPGVVRTCCTREISTMQKWEMLALCFVLIVHSQWKYLLNTKRFLFSAWFIALSAKAIYQCISTRYLHALKNRLASEKNTAKRMGDQQLIHFWAPRMKLPQTGVCNWF